MKKTLLTFIIALLVTTGAWAQTTFTVDNLTYEIIDATTRTVELTGYETEPTGALNIPATVTHNSIEYSVTKIGQDALERCSALTAVTIPDGVTDIGSYAFFKCTALTTVYIGSSLTNIGEFVFDYCKALTQINVNEANTAYCSENGILFNKEKTTLLQYPAGKTETTYTVPGSVTIIGENAFAYCAALTQIILQEGVTTIDYYAFDECTALTQITLPQSLTSIERYAFADCTALTAMTVLATVPPSVVSSNAFQNVSRDIPVYVPAASLTAYQAAEVWSEFTNLQAISTTFTVDNLTYEIIDATTRTVELTGYETEPTGALNIPATVTHNSIEYSVTKIGQDALERCSALTAVTIPDGVTDIGSYAFFKCTALTTVNIGSSLTNIGEFVFDYCNALTQINVNEANSTYCSENGILFNKEKTTLLQYPAGKTETTYTVPGSVTIIGENAFAYCAALTQIILQEGVTTIDYYAFDECTALTQITLPQSLTSIERYAFADCTALTAMTVLATVPPSVVSSNAFQNVSRDIPVYVPAASLTAYQAAEVWNEFTNLQAISTTGLQTPAMPESIRMQGGMLHNPQQLHLTLYDMQGRQVYSGTAATLSQPAGVYVVRCAGASGKVVF